MKQIITSILLLTVLHSSAQDIDRTKAPEPGPAPVINIPDAASFVLPNGLKVFVVRNTKLPRVSATLTIDRNGIKEGSKAGMSGMAGALLRYGTTKMSKEKLDEEIDFLGGSINTTALSVSASSLTANFPKIMTLMSDVTLRPSFPASQLENIRTQTLSGIEASKDDPDAISTNVANVLLYGKGHAFGEIPTEKSIKSVTVADVKKFYNSTWKPNIAYLVFVGDITVEQAKKLATQNFGAWAKGVVAKEVHPVVKAPAKTYIAIVDRPSSVQSVIKIVTPVQLKPGAPDAIAASLMNTILGAGFSSRLMQNLREKYGFTYGAGSSLSTNPVVGNFSAHASVRNEKTDSAIGQFLYEIDRISTEVPGAQEVSSLKNYISGGFARSLEDPATIANFALNIARYHLPKDYYRNYLTQLAVVTPNTVRQVADKYISGNTIITIVGNAKEIAPGLEKYGEVKYFDMYGNPAQPPITKTVDIGIKPEDILKKAVEAYGGEAAIAAVKDLEMTGKVNVMGQSLDYVQKNIFPSTYKRAILMSGMVVMEEIKTPTKYSASMQGNEIPIDSLKKEELDARSAVFEERYMLKQTGYTYKVAGLEQVDGKDCYVLAIKTPAGNSSTAYYEVASGLKVQEKSERDGGPMGKLNITAKILEYKTVEGVKVPVKFIIDLGQFKQEINIESVKINQGLKESDL